MEARKVAKVVVRAVCPACKGERHRLEDQGKIKSGGWTIHWKDLECEGCSYQWVHEHRVSA